MLVYDSQAVPDTSSAVRTAVGVAALGGVNAKLTIVDKQLAPVSPYVAKASKDKLALPVAYLMDDSAGSWKTLGNVPAPAAVADLASAIAKLRGN